MMTRRFLHLLLILAFATGILVPAGLTRCEVQKSCCGCGPAMEMAGCCCGPEAASSAAPAPAPRVDVPLDWTALAVDPVLAVGANGAALAGTVTRAVHEAGHPANVPIFLANQAFLI